MIDNQLDNSNTLDKYGYWSCDLCYSEGQYTTIGFTFNFYKHILN